MSAMGAWPSALEEKNDETGSSSVRPLREEDGLPQLLRDRRAFGAGFSNGFAGGTVPAAHRRGNGVAWRYRRQTTATVPSRQRRHGVTRLAPGALGRRSVCRDTTSDAPLTAQWQIHESLE
jgi:hypothetical protein